MRKTNIKFLFSRLFKWVFSCAFSYVTALFYLCLFGLAFGLQVGMSSSRKEFVDEPVPLQKSNQTSFIAEYRETIKETIVQMNKEDQISLLQCLKASFATRECQSLKSEIEDNVMVFEEVSRAIVDNNIQTVASRSSTSEGRSR